MANFSLTNSTAFNSQQTMGTSYIAVVAVAATSLAIANAPAYAGLRRGKIYDILIGTNATPADTYVEWAVIRGTATTTAALLGAVSSVSSATVIDTGDVSVASLLVVNASAGSTAPLTQATAGQLWYVGINQRASYRWVAAPGSELVWPAASSTGGNNLLQLAARGSYANTVTATVLGSEQ